MKRLLVGGAVLAVGIGSMGVSQAQKPAESGFKVTGGGQIISDAQEAEGGPGTTVGFNAHELDGDDPASPDTDDLARGQFQYNPHGNTSEQNQPANAKFHGVVTCLISGGEADLNEQMEEDGNDEEQLVAGSARFGGYVKGQTNDDGSPIFFTVDVTDRGQGSEAEDDLILVRMTDAPCADNPEDEENEDPQPLFELGRGNVKIHNNPDGEASMMANARMTAAMVQMATR